MKRPNIHPAWLAAILFAGIIIGILMEQLILSHNKTDGSPAAENSTVQTGSISDSERNSSQKEMPPSDPASSPVSDQQETAGTSGGTGSSGSSPENTAAAPQKEDTQSSETWKADQVYYGGDRVLYNGKYYKAKWWTQNELPGKSDVWEDTLEAPPRVQGDGDNNSHSTSSGSGASDSGVSDSSRPDSALPETDHDSGPSLPASGTVSESDFRIVAYYPSWYSGSTYSGTSLSDRLQFDKLTHVIYAFAIPKSDGSLCPLENASAARELIKTCHSYGVKVMIAIGGWSYNDVPLEQTFVSATETPEKIRKFADEILSLCDDYGFDGVDMDWEHPRTDGSSSAQYEELMLLLAKNLHGNGKLLSSAVLSGATADGNIYYDAAAHTDSVLAAVDWINVMAYDGGDGERHSGYDFAVNCGLYWKETRGVPASKINLGVPFYGRPSWAAYSEILAQNGKADETDVSTVNGMEAHYNGTETMKKKTQYAKKELGGIMIWEITQDTADREKSLLTAIYGAAAGK